MEEKSEHIPVLLQETIDGLNLSEGGLTVVDATLGRGGHTKAIAARLGNDGMLIGLDADERNVVDTIKNLRSIRCKTHFITENFRNIERALSAQGIHEGGVDRFLFDLGLNSLQLESSGRGFSFQVDEPLLMTLAANPADAVTAQTIVGEWSEKSLEAILRGFGGEQFSGRIARVIAEERKKKKIISTFDLVQVIEKAVPEFYKHRRIHFATKTFQALRIAVNEEFDAISKALDAAWRYLRAHGRIAVISFHEGEDRIIKTKFKDFKKAGGVIRTKKPVEPSRQEIEKNPRSRSAKLRIMEKP